MKLTTPIDGGASRDQMRWQAMVAMATGYANCSTHDNPAELAVACRVSANALLAEWDYACEAEREKGGTT